MIRRKRKQKSKSLKIIFIFTIILILLAAGIFLYKYFLSIKQIEILINGADCVTNDQIKEIVDNSKQNLFFTDDKKIVGTIKGKFICIKNITFSRSFPNKIKAEVASREAVAELITLETQPASSSSVENISTPSAEEKTDTFIVDQEGVIFSKDAGNFDIPKIFFYNSKISLGQNLGGFEGVLKILSKMKALNLNISRSWIEEDLFIADTLSNTRIIFKLDERVDIQIASLQLILAEAKINHRTIPIQSGIDSSNLEFIDLRFDKPIVRFAPKKN